MSSSSSIFLSRSSGRQSVEQASAAESQPPAANHGSTWGWFIHGSTTFIHGSTRVRDFEGATGLLSHETVGWCHPFSR
eukprot:6034807-Prymnesium_polylepis.2